MRAKPAAVFLDFATMGPDIDTAPLDALLDLRCFDTTAPDEVASRLVGRRVAVVNKTRLLREDLHAADALELIVLSATGTDNIDLDAARSRGIAVANIRDYCSPAVAQHVFALVLTLNQGIVGYDRLAKSGDWSRSGCFAMFDFPIRELAGCKLGIVGYG
jgi:glycerate dehydrogenase